MTPPRTEPATRDELLRLEARLVGRLQEVHARLVLHDGRFAAVGDRIDQTDRRNDALHNRLNSRDRALDGRFGSIGDQIARAAQGRCDELRCLRQDLATCRRRVRQLTAALVLLACVVVVAGTTVRL